jgi:hypothetical protein
MAIDVSTPVRLETLSRATLLLPSSYTMQRLISNLFETAASEMKPPSWFQPVCKFVTVRVQGKLKCDVNLKACTGRTVLGTSVQCNVQNIWTVWYLIDLGLYGA